MKWSQLLPLAATTAGVAAASAACGSVPVFVYIPDEEPSNRQQTLKLTTGQAQLALADFVDASRYAYLSDPAEAQLIEDLALHGSDMFNTIRDSALVVVDTNGDSRSKPQTFAGRRPEFEIAEAPENAWFGNFFDDIASVLGSLPDMVSSIVSHGFYVVHHFDRRAPSQLDAVRLSGLDDANSAHRAVLDDIARLRYVGKHGLQHGLVHLRSLTTLEGTEYDVAYDAIEREVRELAKRGTMRLAVALLPADRCTNEAAANLGLKPAGMNSAHRAVRRSTEATALPLVAGQSRAKRTAAVKYARSYSSQDKCQQLTNSCHGHGECVQQAPDSWACACKPTKSEAGLTTYWGGSACEKKDVSAEFQLLLWTSVALIVTAGASVGLLYSMDSDPLPGILTIAKKS